MEINIENEGPGYTPDAPDTAETPAGELDFTGRGMEIIGASSDHLVLDTGGRRLPIGAEIPFQVNYSALLRGMTSPFVDLVLRPASLDSITLKKAPDAPGIRSSAQHSTAATRRFH